jgi:threonine/homoserine/homoserine lactone efflux protein
MGPIFFTLIYGSADKGLGFGLKIGAGIWFSDLLFISGFGLIYSSPIFTRVFDDYFPYLKIFGALFFILFGIIVIMKKSSSPDKKKIFESGYSAFFAGFSVNTFNPFTLVFWTGLYASIQPITIETYYYVPMISALLFTIIIGDAIKIFFANKILRDLTESRMRILRIVAGLAIIIFGLVLMIDDPGQYLFSPES